MRITNLFCTTLLVIGLLLSFEGSAQNDPMAKVEGGTYTPLYGAENGDIKVEGFWLDVYPVTQANYLAFVKKNPRWRSSKVPAIFATKYYLSSWESDTVLGKNINPNIPINQVSWYAAKAYCQAQGKRLPEIDEWEYAAMADEEVPNAREKDSYNEFILSWYEKPRTNEKEVGSTFRNYWGVYDLHGLVWEWTADFNSVILKGDSRDSDGDNNLFCGAAAIGATDLMNYAAFMRYAFRESLVANYASKNLGFRCAKDLNEQKNNNIP